MVARHSDRVPAAATESPPSNRRVTPSRVAIVLIMVGVVGLWTYALTRQPQPPPDRIDDSAFSTRAEEVCQATATQRDALPQAFETADPTERAAVVAQSNEELGSMLTTLRGFVPTAERDQRMLTEWLGDWETFLGNRRDYVERLRADGDARIYVSEKDSRQITFAIDRFAEVNDMPACRTPKDVS